jgi:hypothetical protein
MSGELGVVLQEGAESNSHGCDGEQPATSSLRLEAECVAGPLSETVIHPPDPEIFALAEAPGWATPQQLSAAYFVSLGLSDTEAAGLAGVSRTTLWRWMTHDERGAQYKAFVGRLTYLTGLARRSERLAMAKRMALHLYEKEMAEGQKRHTSLDWFRHVAELSGEMEAVPLPWRVRLAQQVIVGTQINVGLLAPGLSDSADGAEEQQARPSEQTEGQRVD